MNSEQVILSACAELAPILRADLPSLSMGVSIGMIWAYKHPEYVVQLLNNATVDNSVVEEFVDIFVRLVPVEGVNK